MDNLGSFQDETTFRDIGEKIRVFRKKQNLTVGELATQCGLSTSLISQIERGISTPSLDSLWKITKILGISFVTLFEENSDDRVTVIPREEQKLLSLPKSNVSYRILSPSNRRNQLECLLITLKPGTSTKEGLFTHTGEECGVIIQGEMTVVVGDKSYILREGDSMYLDSTLPHRYFNHGEEVCKSYWAMTPASF